MHILMYIYLRKACSFVEQKALGLVKKVYSARRYTSSKAALNDNMWHELAVTTSQYIWLR